MDNTLLIVFIGLTTLALVVQACVMVGLFVAVKKALSGLTAVADQLKQRGLPLLESASDLLTDLSPKMKVISTNLVDTTTTIKGQIEKLDTALTSISEKAQAQVDRADHLVSSTINKVENTTTILQKAVLSPVQHVAGLINGLTVGVTSLFHKQHRAPNGSGADDEMFI